MKKFLLSFLTIIITIIGIAISPGRGCPIDQKESKIEEETQVCPLKFSKQTNTSSLTFENDALYGNSSIPLTNENCYPTPTNLNATLVSSSQLSGDNVKENRKLIKRKRKDLKTDSEPSKKATPLPEIFINNLPEELLLHIFSFLHQEDIPRTILACQHWQRLLHDNSLWKGYAIRAGLFKRDKVFYCYQDFEKLVRNQCIASFEDLNTLNGGDESWCEGISPDGSVIFGNANDGAAQNQSRAFKWTKEAGMESLGVLNSGRDSIACGASFDGSHIVGHAEDGTREFKARAFKWSQYIGIEPLGTLNNDSESFASGINLDGSVIVGYLYDSIITDSIKAIQWTKQGGIKPLGNLNNGSESWAFGISSNNKVIFGAATGGATADQTHACKWADNNVEFIGNLNNGTMSVASGINAEGSIIVGQANDGAAQNQKRAFRWTKEAGMESLGTLNNNRGKSYARGISADGLIICGGADNNGSSGETRAFKWTQEAGMQSIEQLLKDKGLLPAHWTLTQVKAVSANGFIFVGQGYLNGQQRGWRAVLPRGSLF